MVRYFFFSAILVACFSCSNSDSKSSSSKDSTDLVNQRKDIADFNFDAIKIDTFQKNDPLSLERIAELDSLMKSIENSDTLIKSARKFIQMHENDSLMEVPDFDGTPEEFFASYAILEADGKVIFVSESPNSNAGDWSLVKRYYFDRDGDIQAFSVYYLGFDSGLEGGLLIEKLLLYYGSDKELLKRKYQITDTNDKMIDFRKMEIIPEFHDATGVNSLEELLKQKPFLRR